jgi:hypothetical protein
MMPMWLIATNFVREQRVVIYVLLGWLAFFGILYTGWEPAKQEDLVFFFRQFAAYALILTVLLAAQGFHNDRKTRRMIAVLAKGITRRQFLGGYLIGCALFSAIYVAAFGAIQLLFGARLGFHAEIWGTLFAIWIVSILGAAVALVFATFLPPLLVSIAALLLLVLPASLVLVVPGDWSVLFPVAHVTRHLMSFEYGTGWTGGWMFVPVAIAQTLFFWIVAAVIFDRQDVTAAIE